MYATLYDLFLDLFGLDILGLRIANTFGFFVAISFLISSYVMSLELKRKEKEGILKSKPGKVWEGKGFPASEYIISVVLGFILGFKGVYVFINSDALKGNPQEFLLSGEGSMLWGLILAAVSVGYKYYKDKKQKKAEPILKEITIHPHNHMGYIVMIALIAGLIGAKIFHNLENWDEFSADPWGSLVSFSGLTFYGGLICGAIGVLWYGKKNGIPMLHMLDTGAPTMMLAYALGRIGCQVSGDGDWGIANTAAKPDWLSWAPDWIWAYDYPNNVNNAGVRIADCARDNCYHLDPMVFPTPFYETVMCSILFVVIWKMRKKVNIPGVLFAIYMIMSGLERFFIEKIRVNTTYELAGFQITQAEIISSLMILGGISMWLVLKKKAGTSAPAS
jgi:phosphatidylglycerol:prolipoprotein diacylglycerol transferase